jgi:hypothetical protein
MHCRFQTRGSRPPRSEIVTDPRKSKTTAEALLSLRLSSLASNRGVCPSLMFGNILLRRHGHRPYVHPWALHGGEFCPWF